VFTISSPQLLIDGHLSGPGRVSIENGRIRVVEHGAGVADIALSTGILTAGMIDLQVNGFAGVDFVSGTREQWANARLRIAQTGVTSFLATFITAQVGHLAAALTRASEYREDDVAGGARVLGVHLEGPFLSAARCGAHDASLMLDPTAASIEALIAAGGDTLTLVTLAPERSHALEAIKRLTQAGVVVSLGHTNADFAQALAGADAGARMITHLFNAMPHLGHREPGIIGLALTDQRLSVGLIADLQHVAPQICELTFRAAPGRVVLVTDAISATGMPSGRYDLGGVEVTVEDGLPRRDDGTIAGAIVTLDQAVRGAVLSGVGVAEALDAATRSPAQVLARTDIGVLELDARADLVWWSDDLIPQRIWIDGTDISS